MQDVELAGVDADSSVAIRVRHDDKLPDNSDAHFQIALLYTTSSGHRRIRVHTLTLRVSAQYADVYRAADMDALLCSVAKLGLLLEPNNSDTTLYRTYPPYSFYCPSMLFI